MKLYKPSNSEYWFLEVVTEAGNVRSISTFCKTKAEAESVVAASKVRELEQAGKVHRLTSDVVALIACNRLVKVEAAIAEWWEWMKIGVRSPRTRENNASTVRTWAREMAVDRTNIGQVTSDCIHTWVNDPNRPHKLGTRHMKLAAVRNFMRFCGVKRYVLSDPSRLVSVDFRAISHEQRETKHKLVFEDDEIEFLLDSCDNDEPSSMTPGFFKSAIILGRDLALRLGDICSLEWPCFNMDKGVVVVWTDKTNSRMVIPMTDRVQRLVTQLPKTDERFLFPKEHEIINDCKRRSMISVYFSRFLQSVGFEGFSFHSLRATMATSMAGKGATIEEIATALGHKGTSATRSYIRKAGAANPAISK